MNRRSLIIQSLSVLAISILIAKKSNAIQRIYPKDFHTGGVDWTMAFVAAINAAGDGKEIYVEKGVYRIDPIYFKSNVRMLLEKGVVIRRYGGYLKANDCMFYIRDVDNVTIIGYGAVLDMDAQNIKGDWRHNVAIEGSSNIKIEGLKSTRAGGDGFYVGRSVKGEKAYSNNILLEAVSSDSNRRQGLSIVSAKKCVVKNSSFSKTAGTSPSAGIDIEPDRLDEVLEDIVIENCKFNNNYGPAISIITARLQEKSNVTINVIQCESYRDRHGFAVGERIGKLGGNINIDKFKIEQSKYSAIRISGYDSDSSTISIDSPQIIDPNMSGTKNQIEGSAIFIGMEKKTGRTRIGNIKVSNMILKESIPRTTVIFHVYDYREDLTLSPQKIEFVNPQLTIWKKSRGPAIKVTKGVVVRGVDMIKEI